ncbi:F0F1 ATP synthase subunit gamma [Desulfothermus okinawensis JCM 13304]
MPSLKDVKKKIESVQKTQQITRAMNMVASAKLRRAQERIEKFRPYADKYYEMLKDLSKGVDVSVHPLLEPREEIKSTGIVLITSERGLCGAFNTNLINKAERLIREKSGEGKAVKVLAVGRKAAHAAKKAEGVEVLNSYVGVMDNFDFTLANKIGLEIIKAYEDHVVDEVFLIYGQFVSILRQEPVSLKILPVTQPETEEEEEKGPKALYMYEPSVEGLLAELLPRFIKVQVYRGMLDTSASEHAARMTAMDTASKNCDEMIHKLTLAYNKARQAAITAELLDIVGGAEALKG